MSSILILYATSHGHTRAIAERIAARLRAHGHEPAVVEASERRPRANNYDAVVLGSRVEYGRHARSITSYITSNREALRDRPTAFFSVSLNAAADHGPDPSGYLAKLFGDTGWYPAHAVAFAGALPYTRYNAVLRLIMKWISRRAGEPTDTSRDYVFTDWAAVDGMADTFADDITAPGHALPRVHGAASGEPEVGVPPG